MEEKEVKIRYTIYHSTKELPKEEQLLLEKAKIATKTAYAPYSAFNVGAAILLENGIIVIGNNQENAAYPSGLCAERVAMFASSSHHPNIPMKIIAITANSEKFEVNFPVSPCGSCCQVMSEYETKQKQPIKVILMGSSGDIQVIETVSDLLPFMFHANELKQK